MNLNTNIKKISKKLLITIGSAICLVYLMTALSGCAPNDYKPKLGDAKVFSPDILEDGVLKVGVDADNPPLAGQSSKIIGIDVDVAAAIADELGLKLEVVDVGSSPSAAIKNKKVDIVLGLEKAVTVNEVWKSEPYLQTASALFSKNPNAPVPKKTDNYKIETQMASASALAVQNQFNSTNIKVSADLSSVFSDLKNDVVDYAACDAVIGTYTAHNMDYEGYIVALLHSPGGYCAGVSKSNTEVQKQVKKALDSIISSGKMSTIENKWLGRNLKLDSVPKTESAGNQVDTGDVESAVYGNQTGTAEHS